MATVLAVAVFYGADNEPQHFALSRPNLPPLATATELHQLNLADLTKKAEQGNAIAHYQLGNMYQFGAWKKTAKKPLNGI